MSATMIDPTSREWAYYTEVRTNGRSASEVAREYKTSPGAVGNGVRNVENKLANGAVAPGATASDAAPTTKVNVTMEGVAAEMYPLIGPLLLADRSSKEREVARVEQQIDSITTRLHEAKEAIAQFDHLAKEASGFEYAAVVAEYEKRIAEAADAADADSGDEPDDDESETDS